MRGIALRLSLVSALFLSACAPASQPASQPAPTSPPAAAAKPTTAAPAAAKPAATTAPAAAAKPAATTAPAAVAKPADAAKPSGQVIFFSNQFKPVEEQEKMRNMILKDAPVQVEYIPEDPGPFNDRITSEQRANRVSMSLIGGLHGDLEVFAKAGQLEDLTALSQKLQDRGFPQQFQQLSKYGTQQTYYIPWMQATYVLAVNKKALEYLPAGADVNALTYAQLKEWGANMQKATNKKLIGFPAGPKGLMHRFFQGYLYPSYTGSAGVVGFKTPEAVQAWTEFKDIWQYVNPQSTNYEFMQEPLLSEEVWVAFDHVARLINAPKEKPNDFVMVPAPAGPKARGFMPVLAGLSIPKGAPNRAGAEAVIDFLTAPKQQTATAVNLAFFPVTNAPVPTDVNPGIRLEAEAVQKQAAAKDALVSLLPVGLGAKGGDFNNVYLETFQRIVLRNENVQQVLENQAPKLQAIMDETKAPCWAPDPAGDGPCKVK